MIDVSDVTIYNCPDPCCYDYNTCLAVSPTRCRKRLSNYYEYAIRIKLNTERKSIRFTKQLYLNNLKNVLLLSNISVRSAITNLDIDYIIVKFKGKLLLCPQSEEEEFIVEFNAIRR